ncbi:right-handed parallel beta-helix repeat-containing protein [Candidatus Sumerlaeota bacterium]|nr:right-handed parallel beta-helix repeat-containing protein [Candidatus Sumerlaeota bacterium]
MSQERSLRLIIHLSLALTLIPGLALAGSLNPPGAPAGSMVTLDEISTEIGSAQDPRTPIDTLPFNIIESGSYVLISDLTATGASAGILIGASDVDIDLNGFSLLGNSTGTNGVEAMLATPEHSNIVIHDGTIRDWTGKGISLGSHDFVTLERVRVIGCGDDGAVLADHGSVIDCTLADNGFYGLFALGNCRVIGTEISGNYEMGAQVSGESVVSSCLITGNGVGTDGSGGGVVGGGLALGGASVLENSTISGNMGTTGLFYGFGLFTLASTVQGCTISGNATIGLLGGSSIIDNVIYNNGGPTVGGGITTGSAVVSGNSVAQNLGDGINAQGSMITGNACYDNDDAGITTGTSGNSLVENNVCVGNDVGIESTGSENLIVRNLCLDNTTNDYVAGDGTALPQNPGTNFTNGLIPHPWANFEN